MKVITTQTITIEQVKHEAKENQDKQDQAVLREIRLINAGLICCQTYTEPVEGDREGRLRHCPHCMANYKLRKEDLGLLRGVR
jgi:hypothetical protein